MYKELLQLVQEAFEDQFEPVDMSDVEALLDARFLELQKLYVRLYNYLKRELQDNLPQLISELQALLLDSENRIAAGEYIIPPQKFVFVGDLVSNLIGYQQGLPKDMYKHIIRAMSLGGSGLKLRRLQLKRLLTMFDEAKKPIILKDPNELADTVIKQIRLNYLLKYR